MSRKWPFEHHDDVRCLLRILPSVDKRDCALVRTEGGSARVPAAELPLVVAALYEAAGLPVPVILGRPEPRELLVPGRRDEGSWVTVEHSPDTSAGARAQTRDGRGIPGVMLSLEGVDGGSIRLVGDEPLRVALALVDAMHPAVDEPDPADVKELDKVIAAMPQREDMSAPPTADIARAALRWMRDKQQRGGEPRG